MTHPGRDLNDVNAHLEALFLIGDMSKPDPSVIEHRLALTSHREDAADIMRYLAGYAAVLLRRLHEFKQLPSEPTEYLLDVGELVAESAPRPE